LQSSSSDKPKSSPAKTNIATINRVARFVLVQTYQNLKIYQMTTNYTIRPKIAQNCRKIFQTVIKYKTFSIPRPSKFLTKIENKPSGNPGYQTFRQDSDRVTRLGDCFLWAVFFLKLHKETKFMSYILCGEIVPF
jgi:hypothetical protein